VEVHLIILIEHGGHGHSIPIRDVLMDFLDPESSMLAYSNGITKFLPSWLAFFDCCSAIPLILIDAWLTPAIGHTLNTQLDTHRIWMPGHYMNTHIYVYIYMNNICIYIYIHRYAYHID